MLFAKHNTAAATTRHLPWRLELTGSIATRGSRRLRCPGRCIAGYLPTENATPMSQNGGLFVDPEGTAPYS